MKIKGCLPHQIEFAMATDERYTALVGGFRSGKTRAMLYRYIYLSWLRKGAVKLLVVAPTYRTLRDVDIPLFLEYFDEKGIPYTYNKTDYVITVHSVVMGSIIFRSGDKPERIIGFEVSDFIIDEFDTVRSGIQKDLWTKCIARVSAVQGATCSIVTTPEGFKETHTMFVERGIGKLIRAKTTDNHYLPEDYIASLYDQYDEKLVDQYIHGEFVNLNNMSAYYGFDRRYNVVDSYVPITNEVHIGIDFNVNPFCATVGEFDGKGSFVVFKEYYLENANTQKFCDMVYDDFPTKKKIAYPDLSGVKRQTSAALGVTDLVILKKNGFEVKGNRRSQVRDRLNATNNALSKGLVLITADCKKLVRDLEQVVLVDNKIDETNKELTHISDALSYCIERLHDIRLKR
jgi:hypothetical protein